MVDVNASVYLHCVCLTCRLIKTECCTTLNSVFCTAMCNTCCTTLTVTRVMLYTIVCSVICTLYNSCYAMLLCCTIYNIYLYNMLHCACCVQTCVKHVILYIICGTYHVLQSCVHCVIMLDSALTICHFEPWQRP